MNRRLLRTLAVLAFIAVAIFVIWVQLHSQKPRFIAGSPAPFPTIKDEWYTYFADAPFANDRMWTFADTDSRHRHLYLYDLRQGKIVGELFNAEMPSLSSRDGSRLLVSDIESNESFMQRILGPLLRLIGIRWSGSSQRIDTFWIVDTSRNSAKKIGSLSQFFGIGSTWRPSPDFRYGYTVPTTMQTALYLCELEQPSWRQISISGYPCGWWDEHDILIDMGNNQFDLLDIGTETTRSLFTAADFQTLLAKSAITNTPPAIAAAANWNGKNFDFYFAIKDQISGLTGSNSFVLRASADSPQLALLSPQFQFHWDGYFDRDGKHYLYPGDRGQPGSSGNGAVYLQDLTSGAVSTIVPPDKGGIYSIPQFYGNEVIYIHDLRLHRIGLDGSNDAVVLSPYQK